MTDWRVALLRNLGYKPTKQNLRFLGTWQRWEGGHTNNDARYNWLNTTRGTGPTINSVGVRRYGSFDEGIRYTAETLQNGKYQDVLDALRSGDPYALKPVAGLSTWVSGSPTARLDYASKVLGMPVEPKRPTKPRREIGNGAPPRNITEDDTFMDIMSIAWADDPEFLATLRELNYEPVLPAAPRAPGKPRRPKDPENDRVVTEASGGFLQLPTKWKSTHPTSGLEDEGFTTAIDIMGTAGTRVGAPEDGVVVYFHPDGAQGGGSMLLRTKSGREYWMGHIANGVKAGTRVKRGQRIADVSADHARPHVHLDRRG